MGTAYTRLQDRANSGGQGPRTADTSPRCRALPLDVALRAWPAMIAKSPSPVAEQTPYRRGRDVNTMAQRTISTAPTSIG